MVNYKQRRQDQSQFSMQISVGKTTSCNSVCKYHDVLIVTDGYILNTEDFNSESLRDFQTLTLKTDCLSSPGVWMLCHSDWINCISLIVRFRTNLNQNVRGMSIQSSLANTIMRRFCPHPRVHDSHVELCRRMSRDSVSDLNESSSLVWVWVRKAIPLMTDDCDTPLPFFLPLSLTYYFFFC